MLDLDTRRLTTIFSEKSSSWWRVSNLPSKAIAIVILHGNFCSCCPSPCVRAYVRSAIVPFPSATAQFIHPSSINIPIPDSRFLLIISILSRRTPTPNTLQKPIPLGKSIQRIVTLSPTPYKPTQRVHLVLARVPALLVDFAHADLYAGVVFGFDDAVGRAAFAGDVEINDVAFFVLHFVFGLGGCCYVGFVCD